MDSTFASIAEDLTRSMQYMNARNGGLLVDFTPIQRYSEVAFGGNHYERVRTVLDWIAFAVEVGLLSVASWHKLFAHTEDFPRFAAELRRYDLHLNERHMRAFEQLGLAPFGEAYGYADIANAIESAFPCREVA